MNPTGRERELARLAGQIQTLTLEIRNLRQRGLETPFVLLVIVATGKHFFLDAAAGALVAGLAAALAALLTRRPATARLAAERTQLGDRVGRHNGCLVLRRG